MLIDEKARRGGPVPCPIPYQGSKRKLAPAIVRCFPPDVARLYEPFCGSAAVALAAAARVPALREIHLNDSYAPLVALWRAIVEDPEWVADRYEAVWRRQLGLERAYYDAVRTEFNLGHQPELLLYLLARCVKAAVRCNSHGEFNQSPDNRRLGSRPPRMRAQVRWASQLLAGRTFLTAVDYVTALAPVTDRDVVYLDPPYQGVSANHSRRYWDTPTFDGFAGVLGALNDRGISYIVSYDGRTGDKQHGKPLPEALRLTHVELNAGRSAQATLGGEDRITYESLYLSPALVRRLGGLPGHLGALAVPATAAR